MLPRSAERYGRTQRREIAVALASVRRSWRRMSTNFDLDWPPVAAAIVQTLTIAQGRVLEPVPSYITSALRDTGQRVPDQRFTPNMAQFIGLTGGGTALGDALAGAIPRTKRLVGDGMSARMALVNTGGWLTRLSGTILSDTARGGEQLGMKSISIDWYVRMLSAPSCGRCVILAGKEYRTERAFERHPGCDCRHVPVSEKGAAKDLVASVDDYLGDADDTELARVFGSKANAQAYKDGADPSRLINAYRGRGDVYTAQRFGRDIKATTVNASRRRDRLMPATIYQISADQAEAERLLRLYGWVL